MARRIARPPFALERIERVDDERILYHLPKPTPDGETRLTLRPLEFISRLAALIPAPRLHRHRYYGVLAPNARLRPAVTALACEARPTGEAGTPANAEEDKETGRSPARYLWAMLLARLYAVFPLLCASCGAPMRIIAFIAPIPQRPVRSSGMAVSLPHHHRSPPPAVLAVGTARRRPRKFRDGASLRSIPRPITTSIKASHGDGPVLPPETVTVSPAPMTAALRDLCA